MSLVRKTLHYTGKSCDRRVSALSSSKKAAPVESRPWWCWLMTPLTVTAQQANVCRTETITPGFKMLPPSVKMG